MVITPTVISTFAGCGGSSLGYHLAGYKELLAVEWDKNAIETFQLNFPNIPIYGGDIHKLTNEGCRKLAGNIAMGELDVFDGSPPCQGFSLTGKRDFNDVRNTLFLEYVRLIKYLQPKVFIMENVKGMISGAMKQKYLECVTLLREAGYNVRGEVLNAMYYNVPQSRQRVIIMGVRNDLGILPTFPKPQSKPITVKQAFENVSKEDNPKFSKLFTKYYAVSKQGGSIGRYKSIKRLHENKPSCTLTKTQPEFTPAHPTECRGITTAERKRLASFPDTFKFTSAKTAVERIGNSVPPNLMRAIAEHVKNEILAKISDCKINGNRDNKNSLSVSSTHGKDFKMARKKAVASKKAAPKKKAGKKKAVKKC